MLGQGHVSVKVTKSQDMVSGCGQPGRQREKGYPGTGDRIEVWRLHAPRLSQWQKPGCIVAVEA